MDIGFQSTTHLDWMSEALSDTERDPDKPPNVGRRYAFPTYPFCVFSVSGNPAATSVTCSQTSATR